VSDYHNYYAGDAKVLVHYECECAGIKQILVNSNKIELFDKFHDAVHALNIGSSERKLLFTSIANLGDNASRFILDFIDSPSKLSRFAKESGLVEAWGVVKDGSTELRSNINNLEKLREFITETGMGKSKLIKSFKNTKNPHRWLDMKIPESKLDEIYNDFNNSPPTILEAWSPEHKAQRWANHKIGKPDANYNNWSNQYDGNIDKVASANRGVDRYFSGLRGNVVREKSFPSISINTSDGVKSFTRRLDIVDEDTFKGIEFKEYSSGKVYRSADIRREYALDGKLLKDDLLDEIEWIFKGCEPSSPLRIDLEFLGIKVILIP
jgi:hypothetical protein